MTKPQTYKDSFLGSPPPFPITTMNSKSLHYEKQVCCEYGKKQNPKTQKIERKKKQKS